MLPNTIFSLSSRSTPEPIADEMFKLIESMLGDQDTAREITESAFELASSMPEMQGVLSGVSRADFLRDLEQLRDGNNGSEAPAESAADTLKRETHAKRVAAEAVATAHRSLCAPGSSLPLPSKRPVGSSSRRSSMRQSMRRHSDPLGVLDCDSVRTVLRLLTPEELLPLHRTSRAWREQVTEFVRSLSWRTAHGCLFTTSLISVLCESGVGRLDIKPIRGAKGTQLATDPPLSCGERSECSCAPAGLHPRRSASHVIYLACLCRTSANLFANQDVGR
jgi:hypothetical protein